MKIDPLVSDCLVRKAKRMDRQDDIPVLGTAIRYNFVWALETLSCFEL
jgi:hypothetical protein